MSEVIDKTEASAFDSKAFRNVLGTFPTGVAIITTAGTGAGPVGLTCNSFSSVSLEPPLVAWSLRKASKSLEDYRNAPGFAINILADDQNELSGRFASSRITDKFDGVNWHAGHAGSPVLARCLASFECATFAVHDAGDHLMFIGEVKRFEQRRQDDPLVFYKGAYMMLTQSLRELVSKGLAAPADLNDARARIYGMLLRLACENGTPQEFDAIEAQLDVLERYTAPAEIEQRMQAGMKFFRMIASAAHNEVLAVVADSLSGMLQHAFLAQITQVRQLHPQADLVSPTAGPLRRSMLACMRARDADGALAALAGYVANSTLLMKVEEIVR